MNWKPLTAAAGIGFLGVSMAAPTELWKLVAVILAAIGLLTVAGGILWALASGDDKREMGIEGLEDKLGRGGFDWEAAVEEQCRRSAAEMGVGDEE